MTKQTVTSLAVLTVNWNHGHDVIDSFVPLVADCVRKSGEQPVAVVDLQKTVEKDEGIKIPTGALQAILRRCARDGLVRREHDVYYPQQKKLAQLDYGPLRAEALRRHSALLDKLRTFATERYEIDWSEQEADAALLGWMQEGSLPVLVAATEGDPLPFIKRQSRKTKHVLNAFAGQLADGDPEGFECLETVVKGYILSGVLFYPDLGRFQTQFEQLDVYCDTPFILRALGYSDEGQHVQCLDLVDLLRELGANLKCFHHTREEVVGVLESAAGRLRPGAANAEAAVEYAPAKVFRFTDIEEMILRIDDVLGELDIDVVDTPTWTKEPDEVALEEVIQKAIDYSRDRAREKDVKSLAAVARLRSLRRMDKFENAKAIFVTSNITLARASSTYFHDIEGHGSIPICMPVELMTRLAWVKKPMAAPDLPKHTVIAASYAALNPPIPLWREYINAIAERREKGELSDAEYHFLRSSLEARRALMDETFGDEHAFSAGTLDEVLAHAKQTIQGEAKAEAEAERKGRLEAEETAAVATRKAEEIEQVHHGEVSRRGHRRGLVVGWDLAALVAAAFLAGLFASIPGVPLIKIKSAWVWPVRACVGVFVLLTIATAFRGTTVFGVRRSISARVEAWLCKRGHRKLDELHAKASAR